MRLRMRHAAPRRDATPAAPAAWQREHPRLGSSQAGRASQRHRSAAMHAAGCTPSLAPARAPRALRCSVSRRAMPRAAVSTVAQESMTEAYARIRAQRAKTKARFEREEKLEKAGALGKLISGFVGGASLAKAPSPGELTLLAPPASHARAASSPARRRGGTASACCAFRVAGFQRLAPARRPGPPRPLTSRAPVALSRLSHAFLTRWPPPRAQRLTSRRTSRRTRRRWRRRRS